MTAGARGFIFRAIPKLAFTSNLRRHFDCASQELEGSTVRSLLDAFFENQPRARSYILDDQGALREHMVVFVDGTPLRDRERLSDTVHSSSEVYVMQALSGG